MIPDLSKPITSYQRDRNQQKKNPYLLDEDKKRYPDSLGISSVSTVPYTSVVTKSTHPISPITTNFPMQSDYDLAQTEKFLRSINPKNNKTPQKRNSPQLEQTFESKMNLDGCISVVVK